MGYEQMLDPCRVTGTSANGTQVRCPFDFHNIRSDEIGRGPYHGSYWDITVTDGAISYAHQDWEIERFSPEMWKPFADWVRETSRKDLRGDVRRSRYQLPGHRRVDQALGGEFQTVR